MESVENHICVDKCRSKTRPICLQLFQKLLALIDTEGDAQEQYLALRHSFPTEADALDYYIDEVMFREELKNVSEGIMNGWVKEHKVKEQEYERVFNEKLSSEVQQFIKKRADTFSTMSSIPGIRPASKKQPSIIDGTLRPPSKPDEADPYIDNIE